MSCNLYCSCFIRKAHRYNVIAIARLLHHHNGTVQFDISTILIGIGTLTCLSGVLLKSILTLE